MRITRELLVADSPPSAAVAASSVSPGVVDSLAAQPSPGKPKPLMPRIRRCAKTGCYRGLQSSDESPMASARWVSSDEIFIPQMTSRSLTWNLRQVVENQIVSAHSCPADRGPIGDFQKSDLGVGFDSRLSETYGRKQGRAYNGLFECHSYHPLFLFNQCDDLEGVLRPVVEWYRDWSIPKFFRGAPRLPSLSCTASWKRNSFRMRSALKPTPRWRGQVPILPELFCTQLRTDLV